MCVVLDCNAMLDMVSCAAEMELGRTAWKGGPAAVYLPYEDEVYSPWCLAGLRPKHVPSLPFCCIQQQDCFFGGSTYVLSRWTANSTYCLR